MFVSLQEENIVFGCLSQSFRLQEMEFTKFLCKFFPCLPLLSDKCILIVTLSSDNLRKCVVFIFSLEELGFCNFRVALHRIFKLNLQKSVGTETFFLCCGCVITHVVFLSAKNASGFHSATSVGTKNTSDMQTSTKRKTTAIVANPIVFRDFVNPVAFLMNWDITHPTEHN